jgi:hypothetical protein
MGAAPEVDEAQFQQMQRVRQRSALTAHPVEGDSCSQCYYYLEPGDPISFCWHEKVSILVGSEWWCQFWEMAED